MQSLIHMYQFHVNTTIFFFLRKATNQSHRLNLSTETFLIFMFPWTKRTKRTNYKQFIDVLGIRLR